MKIAGMKLTGPRIETLVLPRQDGDIVIKARAVLDFKEFENMCKEPKPKMKMAPGGGSVPVVTDEEYIKKLTAFAALKTSWMIIESLKATEDLEWETIKPDDPETWGNYKDELKEGGFSFAEAALIVRTVTDACGLNQAKIEEATKLFLAGRLAQREKESSPSIAPQNTESGEPVKESE